MKKKTIQKTAAVLAAAAMMVTMLVGCGKKPEEPEATNMVNPLTEITAEQLVIPMDVPEGAGDVKYFTLNDGSENLVDQMVFTKDGHTFTYRAKEVNDMEASDLSGMHYDSWDSGNGSVDYCDAVVMTNDSAAIVYWLDRVPGINYTLACDSHVSAEEMLAVANEVFHTAQGEDG